MNDEEFNKKVMLEYKVNQQVAKIIDQERLLDIKMLEDEISFLERKLRGLRKSLAISFKIQTIEEQLK